MARKIQGKTYLSPAETESLLAELGVPVARTYLAKLRTFGDGPVFRKLGKHVLYLEKDVADWAWSRLTEPMKSTSDHVAISPAAAQDLLEALENICQRLEQIQHDHNTCDGDLALEEARAAIAKARGK